MLASMDRLPDELLKDVLVSVFHVPDRDFRYTGHQASPFSKNIGNYLTSSVLLVNKAFCRVGTPLLYYTVILRSKAQAHALADTLRANPDLGRWIRQLRVEGGYGSYMDSILGSCAERIIDLCLTLMIFANDNASGLARHLARMNPRRVFYAEGINAGRGSGEVMQNKNIQTLFTALLNALPRWSNMHSFGFPSHPNLLPISRELDLFKVLKTLRSLRTIYFYDKYTFNALADEILTSTNVTALVLDKYDHSTRGFDDNIGYKGSRWMDIEPLIRFGWDRTKPAYLHPISGFTPMANATEDVKAKIWGRILRFAIEDLWTTPSARNTLDVSLERSWANDRSSDTTVTTEFLEWEYFCILSETACQTLRTYLGPCVMARKGFQPVPLEPEPILAFRNLSRMHWQSDVPILPPHFIDPGAFPQLEHLSIGRHPESCSILTLLSQLELPWIHILDLSTQKSLDKPSIAAFLAVHRHKIWEFGVGIYLSPGLVDGFKSLAVLKIHHRCGGCMSSTLAFPQSVTADAPTEYPFLRRVEFHMDCGYTSCDHTAADFSAFHALAEVHDPHCVWPTHEREINVSCWVRRSEALGAGGIRLVDKDGKSWIPRLKNRVRSR
ncbi:hypothetical protein BD626DRAFT_586120 [Schizophyllum amplum]|uniref:Uncharacterized protein n=1 Tax=Schizophyllum amplum TaxID=97359 RepID=A0A550C0Y8_9AGAR|nr:hypothetical protein BD626DRAFT_586120 [Auriculariopsis ampla]